MMKRSELKTLFADMKERLKNVSSDPDEQRLDYQVLANYAVATINRVVNTGLQEDAEREVTNSTKQKKCPYCHEPFRKMRLVDYVVEDDNTWQRFYYENGKYELAIERVRPGYGTFRFYACYPKFCQMCGRGLNDD